MKIPIPELDLNVPWAPPPPHPHPTPLQWAIHGAENLKPLRPPPLPPFFIQILRHLSSSDDVKIQILLQLLLYRFARARPNSPEGSRVAVGDGSTSQKTWLYLPVEDRVFGQTDAAPLIFWQFSPNL